MTSTGVGTSIILYNENSDILIGKRKGSHGAGQWGLPGGRLEFMESPRDRIIIELAEETGIILPHADVGARWWCDSCWFDGDKGQQHWITLFYVANCPRGETPKVMEPDKCSEWVFANPGLLMEKFNLFPPLKTFIERHPVGTW